MYVLRERLSVVGRGLCHGSGSGRDISDFHRAVDISAHPPVPHIWAAHANLKRLSRFGRYGDFSYGIYLFAFPVQQILVHTMGTLHVGPLRAADIPHHASIGGGVLVLG